MGRHFLQIPGPTNVPDRVLRAIDAPTIDHRGPDFAELGHEVLDGMREVFRTEGPVVIYPASGTGAWEAALVNTLSPGDRVLAFETGHFATLLRGTVETFLPDHEVYITDWQDARDVPQSAGDFHLADYVDAMIDMFRHFGGDVHVFSVCQPSVPVLAAVSLMEADNDPCVPLTMSLAGGPIDTRVSPTIVNKLAVERGTDCGHGRHDPEPHRH